MRISTYNKFIEQNSAPLNAKRIVIYNSRGGRVGSFGLQNLRLPSLGEKLYSFGAISDTHLGGAYPTSEADTKRALRYFQKASVAFATHCGDVTAYGSDYECETWKALKESAEFSDLEIYEVAGNHDARPLNENPKLTDERFKQYFGHNLFYTVEKGNDVFIFLSMNTWDNNNDGNMEAFSDKDLQALYETLEANRNKRCFFFEHCFYWYGSGNPNQSYGYDLLSGTQGNVLWELLRHYKNTIFFHGHSHLIFETQEQDAMANYDNVLGIHSIHIPSATQPKQLVGGASEIIVEGEVSEYSQGYVIDVYKNHIVLNGVNFVTEEQLPIATYCLDTALQTIEAGTFTDSTGVITT